MKDRGKIWTKYSLKASISMAQESLMSQSLLIIEVSDHTQAHQTR